MNKFLRKLHLWLIAHGLEFEMDDTYWGAPHNPRRACISRAISIAINHRYYGFQIEFTPFKGAYTDELNTPHAEIAAECALRDAEREAAL